MTAPRLWAAATLLLCLTTMACRPSPPSAAIDPALSSCIPPSAMAIAGVDLKQLRASPMYGKLTASTLGLTEALRDASHVALAWSGGDVTVIAQGDFREPPAGAELIAPKLALIGSPDAIRKARDQHRNRIVGAPELLTYAEPLAVQNPIWVVARGTATFPLTGNLANLNRFLHSTEYTTVGARVGETLSLNIAGICRTAADAQHLERTLRAFLSLATLRSRGPLKQATIAVDDRTVRLAVTAEAADAERLLR